MSALTKEECGFCGSDLRAERIPVESIVAGYYGDRDPEVPHYFSRLIGVEYGYDSPHRYDGVSEWRCPDCSVRVGRWSGRVLADGEYEPRWGAAA